MAELIKELAIQKELTIQRKKRNKRLIYRYTASKSVLKTNRLTTRFFIRFEVTSITNTSYLIKQSGIPRLRILDSARHRLSVASVPSSFRVYKNGIFAGKTEQVSDKVFKITVCNSEYTFTKSDHLVKSARAVDLDGNEVITIQVLHAYQGVVFKTTVNSEKIDDDLALLLTAFADYALRLKPVGVKGKKERLVY